MNYFYIPARVINRFKWAALILFIILIIGTLGYWFLDSGKHSLIDCLYMTVITVTTIGYAEIIDMSGNPAARIFTIFIIFSGVGTSTYILSNLTALIVEGDFKESFKRRRTEKMIKDIDNHYIICGVGRVGSHILKELYTTDRQVIVIEANEQVINQHSEQYPQLVYVIGDASIEDILLKAGIERAIGLFASTGDDNSNLVISLTAKYLNPKIQVVARCLDASNENKLKKSGADSVILENYIAGMRMASEMIRPNMVNFLDNMLSDTEMSLRAEEIELNSEYAGKTIADLHLERFPNTLLLAAVAEKKWIYNPKPEFKLPNNSKIVVITNPSERYLLKDLH
jgi:voltage-gated potassium channel